MIMSILSCENLSKTFVQGNENVQVIKTTNVKFHEGTMNVIMGASGSGKTTMLNLLSGIEQPTEGKVYYRGTDFFEKREEQQAHIRGEHYGIVFQFFHLIPELSVEENISLPAMINGKAVKKKYYKALLELLDIERLMCKRITTLSGGEQQRVAIARAMILKPDIVFADEPTGNLDRKNSRMIADIFKEINSTFHTTFLIVTHDPVLFEHPEYKFVMDDGCLYPA